MHIRLRVQLAITFAFALDSLLLMFASCLVALHYNWDSTGEPNQRTRGAIMCTHIYTITESSQLYSKYSRRRRVSIGDYLLPTTTHRKNQATTIVSIKSMIMVYLDHFWQGQLLRGFAHRHSSLTKCATNFPELGENGCLLDSPLDSWWWGGEGGGGGGSDGRV